jgi:hypothetical protein
MEVTPNLAQAHRVLARCRAANVRVLLLDGKLYGGSPDPDRIEEGCFGWRPPPEKCRVAIERYADAIKAVLGDGSSRPWGVEQLTSGCLLYWPPWPLRSSRLLRRR